MVCVRKPNSLAYRGSVRKPGGSAGRVQEGTAGLGLRTKTEFIGLQGRRTQTGRLCRPGSGGDGRPWFAYENRIHWLSREASANRGAPPEQIPGAPATKVRARKPNSLAFRAGEREPGKPLEQIPDAPAAKVRARKPNSLAFTGDEREPGAPAEQIPGARQAGGRKEEPAGLQKQKNFEAVDLSVRRFKVFSLHITSYL